MDSIDIVLSLREQKQLLKDTKVVLNNVHKTMASLDKKYVAPVDEVTVTNPAQPTDLQPVIDSLNKRTANIEQAIKNIPLAPDAVTVKNMTDAQVDTVSIKNLHEITKELKAVRADLSALETQPIVQVTKEELSLPTSPSKPLAVRLSDGKSWYKAQFSAVAGGIVETDPLVGYQPTDKDTATTTKYYGFTRKNGAWYIMRENTTNGTYRYASGYPLRQGGGLYPDAWTDRTNLSYNYFYEVFNA